VIRESIQKTLDYVENNVKEDITAEDLADIAGYSVFHFYRSFQSAVGVPVMQYILRRKLLHAISEIGSGRKKNDVVYEYGFETYSGFYRSFIREIGYTPADYLQRYKAKKPYKINILQEEHIMVSKKTIAEVLVNWDLQNEKVADIVFPETGEISDTAKYVGEDLVIKYTGNLGNTKKATNTLSVKCSYKSPVSPVSWVQLVPCIRAMSDPDVLRTQSRDVRRNVLCCR
jgi:AraC-like DNA-binding protein